MYTNGRSICMIRRVLETYDIVAGCYLFYFFLNGVNMY